MARVFISYSRKDIDFVRKLAGDLESAGYDVWWDLSDLRGGDDWVNTIPAAIASSPYVVVVLTPDSAESEWVRKEYTQALSLRKKIIPILLKPGNVPFALNTINFVNFTTGEYADRFKELLSALDFAGQPPQVTPYRKALLSLPPTLLKFGIPIGIGVIILLVLLARSVAPPAPGPSPTPSTTPTTPILISTDTDTPTVLPTNSSTATPTPTPTPTPTDTEPANTRTPAATAIPSASPTPTTPPAFAWPICIYIRDGRDANVREGPDSTYMIVGEIQPNGTKCPFFGAQTRNRDQEIWFQFASSQKAEFGQFANKWISADVLAAADLRLLPLPICIYRPGVRAVNARELPSENANPQGSPLEADGTNCPFFTTRLENEEGLWYRFSPDQKVKVEFQQYAGGWIRGDSLVTRTLSLPVITLTPTPPPSQTSTPTPTASQTRTATSTPSETPTEAPTSTSTPSLETPGETPAP